MLYIVLQKKPIMFKYIFKNIENNKYAIYALLY